MANAGGFAMANAGGFDPESTPKEPWATPESPPARHNGKRRTKAVESSSFDQREAPPPDRSHPGSGAQLNALRALQPAKS